MDITSPFDFNDFDSMWNVCHVHKIISTSIRYHWVQYLCQLIDNGQANELNVQWLDLWSRGTDDTPLTKMDVITYNNCSRTIITSILDENGQKIFNVEVVIWNGDSLNGDLTTSRCIVTFKLDKMNKLLSEAVKHFIVECSHELREKEEEEERMRKLHRIQCAMMQKANKLIPHPSRFES